MKMHPWVRAQFKKRARIYIMPTRMGGYLNGLIFLMFLLSVGYSNNLLLIFTLFLFGLNLIWVIQTHFHLHALNIHSVTITEAHANEPSLVRLDWKKSPEGPLAWNLRLETIDQSYALKTLENNSQFSTADFTLNKRGLYSFTHLCVTTEMPFGLYKAWIYLPVKTSAIIYPARLPVDQQMNYSNHDLLGEVSTQRSGPHDIWNLGPYQGEESRRISWKHYAKSGELVVKEGEELASNSVQFTLPQDGSDKELLLSKMATQMVQCSKGEIPFGLQTPGKIYKISASDRHLHECLRELALC